MSDSVNKPDLYRQTIKERLAGEFQKAKIAYNAATEQYKTAIRRIEELRLDAGDGKQILEPADGGLWQTEALKVQSDALESVSRALKAFNRFVVYVELPDGIEPPFSSGERANSFSRREHYDNKPGI